MMLCLVVTGVVFASHAAAFRVLPSSALRARAVSARSGSPDEEANVGRTFRVMGVNYREGAYANLKVFAEPGDPYGKVISLLRHGDEIVCTGYRNFAGQTWIEHMVDESERGLYLGDSPSEPYLAWSPQDISGSRWLQPMDVTVATSLDKNAASADEMLRQTPAGYDKDNLFAKIIRGEMPSYKVFETPSAYALLDAFPAARFHCLLLPKAASVDMSDLDASTAAAFLQELPRLAAAVKAASGAPAVQVISNAGAAAGQVVMHTHVHVVPRFGGEVGLEGASAMIEPEEAEACLMALESHL